MTRPVIGLLAILTVKYKQPFLYKDIVIQMQIRPLTKNDLPKIITFSDEHIGEGYFASKELNKYISPENLSFVLLDHKNEVLGIRLTLPPGDWQEDPFLSGKIKPELWQVPIENTAYFKTIFLHPKIHGQGWGKKLSLASIKALKNNTNTKSIVCHSWKESPDNSSQRYLLRLGFKQIYEHSNFWKDVEYDCVRCGLPCLCTGVEMIKYFSPEN